MALLLKFDLSALSLVLVLTAVIVRLFPSLLHAHFARYKAP